MQLKNKTIALGALALLGKFNIAQASTPVQFILSWGQVANATHYSLEEQQLDGSWKSVTPSPLTELSRAISKQTLGKYHYRVGACIRDASNVVQCGEDVGHYSSVLTVDTSNLGDPNTVALFQSKLGTIEWTPVASTQHYKLERAVCASNCAIESEITWQPISTQVGVSYTMGTQDTGPRAYRVQACSNGTTCSQWSNTLLIDVASKKRVIFIHTDLLGSPVTESN